MTVQPLKMSEVVDPDEVQKARTRRKRSACNLAWLRAHAGEVYTRHRGRHICIAGGELFAAQTAAEALRMARSSISSCLRWKTARTSTPPPVSPASQARVSARSSSRAP